ncbi:MAG: PAS domain S-box protein [Rhodocyclaceae bacterium]|nr:PAS domain S-box protein [Rhodocyclaceae bacterium]
MVIATPRAALDEAAFQRLKHEDFRQPTLFIASACAVLVFSLWLWDWAIDARHAPETLWLRVVLSVSTLAYPLALRAGLRRGLPLIFYAMLVWLQAVFLLILGRLEGGALHGVAGFLFWFIVPPLMSFILPLRANILGNLAVLAAPSLMAGTFGLLPGLDLLHLNAVLVPACGITVVGHVMVDRLLRRIYEYRWQLEWRSVAIDALAEGVVIIQEGLIRYANQAAAVLIGRRPPEIVGTPLADYVRIDDTTDLDRPLRVAAPGGREAWVRVGRSAIVWQGRPATLVSVVDITEQLRADEALRGSEQRYREVVDNVSEGIIVVQDEVFVFFNPAALRVAGYAWEEMRGRSFSDFTYPDDLAAVDDRYRRRIAGETNDPRFEFRVLRKDGKAIWVQLSGVMSQWTGRPANLYFVSDIEERKRAEAALRHSEERYRLLVDHASEGILISQEGILRFVNPRIAELAGRGAAALTGQPLLGFIHPEDHPVLIERFQRRRRGETVPQHEVFRLLRPDGGIVWIEFSGVDVEWEGRPAVLSFLIDITERKRVEDELRRSEANYRSVIESSPIGVAVLHRNRMMLVNQALCRMIEGSEAELLAQGSFIDFVCEEDRDMMRAHADHIAHEPEGGKALVAFRIRTLRGRQIWVEGNTVQVGWQGRPATLSFIHDVTERRRLEENLKQTLAERETILDRSIVGIAFLDPKGRLRWANSAMGRVFGAPMERIVGRSLEPYYVSRESYLATGAAVSAAVLDGKGYETELRMRRGDGSLFWAHLSGKAVNPNDLAQGTVWAVLDIDQRKRLEEDLQRTSSEREAILQSTLVGIIYSKDRRHQWVNRTFADMVGYRQEELIGQPSRLHFPDEASWLRFGEEAYAVLGRGEAFSAEWLMVRRDGSQFWAHIFGQSVTPRDPAEGSIWTLVDITSRKQAEQDIRAALEQQKELNQLKSRFVSMTSHEFRTPLAAILSSAELLKYYGERLPAGEKAELVDGIGQSVRRMTNMLDDVLTIGRAEADRLGFAPAPLALRAFCDRLVEEAVRADQAERGHAGRIEFRMDDGELEALLDEKLMRHILGNLLSNALKYSPEGRLVTLTVEADAASLRFTVEDRGIGIPADDLPRLFESFHRARNVGNISGTGLGLAIVKKAVELHGGRIEVDSKPGAGSRFTVTLERRP